MKKLLLLQIIVTFCIFELNAAEQKIEAHMPNPIVSKHFEESKDPINTYLNEVKDPQLHFFWTTGRTISDNPAYRPITKVEVGGSKFGAKFFPYVEGLLKNSPDKLKVVFVCDTMTEKSNREQINTLQLAFNNRFQLLPIEVVIKNLLRIFPSGDQIKKINILFKNATAGSPVLTSDIYRIIGMFYGQDNLPDPTGSLHSYCDIDAFCHGMEHPSYTELIDALFKPDFKSPFYFGRSHNNNDVIKICIEDINYYKIFCDEQLDRINTKKIIFPKYNKESVIWHFSNIHDIIKECERNPSYDPHIANLIPTPIYELVQEVTQNTGPKFLWGKSVTRDLSYPSETIGAWGAPEEALDHRCQRNLATHPSYILKWGYGGSTPEEERVFEQFTTDCDNYRKVLGAYFYARQFGENHPFNIKAKAYLMAHYPYNAPSFKTLLKLNFDFHKKDVPQYYTFFSVENLSKIKEELYEEDTMYLEEKDGKINFVTISSNKEVIKGTFDWNIEGKLTSAILRKNRNILQEKFSALGIMREPKKGLTYEEWKKSAFNEIIVQRKHAHYSVLTYLLKELQIEFPMTLESLDF